LRGVHSEAKELRVPAEYRACDSIEPGVGPHAFRALVGAARPFLAGREGVVEGQLAYPIYARPLGMAVQTGQSVQAGKAEAQIGQHEMLLRIAGARAEARAKPVKAAPRRKAR
jgi:hypothetical protein